MKVKKILDSGYLKNIFTLMSGTIVSQVLLLLLAPILTRLYLPDEFGAYSLYISVASVLGLVSSLKYDQAIMLPKSENNANALFLLSLIITSLTTLILLIIITLIDQFELQENTEVKKILWYIPVGVFLVGGLQILNAYLSRNQKYKVIASNRVKNSLSMISLQIGGRKIASFEQLLEHPIALQFLNNLKHLDWLTLGKIIADTMSIFLLLLNISLSTPLGSIQTTYSRLKINAKKYNYFPKYQSLTVLSNSVSQNLPVFLLASLYSVEVAGLYALTVRVLKAPINLIGESTREVYYQRASQMYVAKEDIFPLYMKTTKNLAKLFIIPFVLILFFGDWVYAIVFGENWRLSGQFSQILIFWYFLSFINSPSIATYSIISKQNIQMKAEMIGLLFCLVTIYGGYLLFNSYLISIIAYVVVNVLVNAFLILYIRYKLLSQLNNLK
jgi:lipopolysaccharide exporter